ncbi:hypothetical protein A2U01_0094679, partial [Trifolium medium]|nr:hypothetical protein [Trifolium medium]
RSRSPPRQEHVHQRRPALERRQQPSTGSHSSSPRGQSVPDNKKGENDRLTRAASSISPRAIAHDKA